MIESFPVQPTMLRPIAIGLLLQGLNCFSGCKENRKEQERKDTFRAKVDGAVSCTSIGLIAADSILYMQGGGNKFKPSVINEIKPTVTAQGMVWISGGEFSMGGVNPAGMQDRGKEIMNDARPMHRVFVNGFLMDETEVTNAQFADGSRMGIYSTWQ